MQFVAEGRKKKRKTFQPDKEYGAVGEGALSRVPVGRTRISKAEFLENLRYADLATLYTRDIYPLL